MAFSCFCRTPGFHLGRSVAPSDPALRVDIRHGSDGRLQLGRPAKRGLLGRVLLLSRWMQLSTNLNIKQLQTYCSYGCGHNNAQCIQVEIKTSMLFHEIKKVQT